MEKMARNFSKRLVACLLCMALVVTYALPVGVYAESEGNTGTTWIAKQGEARYYTEKGEVVTNPGLGPAGKWAVKTEATAKAVAGEADTYEITLTATTKGDVKTELVAADSATVLVLDMSTSLNSEDIAKIKKGAISFLENYVKDAGNTKRMVAVVEFGDQAKTITHFIDVNDGAGKVSQAAKDAVNSACSHFHYFPPQMDQYCQVRYFGLKGNDGKTVNNVKFADFHKYKLLPTSWWVCEQAGCEDGRKTTEYKHYVTDTQNGIWDDGVYGRFHSHDGGGTNMEGGMMLARNLLNAGLARGGDIEGFENTNVVVFTDGAPTVHPEENDHNATDLILMQYGDSGKNVTAEDYDDIPTIAEEIKASSSLYFITYKIDEKIKVGGKKISTWIKEVVKANGPYYAKDEETLKAKFKEINVEISKEIGASAVVTDNPMGEFIEYTSDDIKDVVTSISDATKRTEMFWTPTEGTESGNGPEKTTVYTVKYLVKVDTSARGFVENKEYAAGENVQLSFKYGPEAKAATVPYIMPTFKGTIPELPYTIEYYKMDKETGEYKQVTGDTYNGAKTKLYTTVNVPAGYATKYDSKAGGWYELASELPEGKKNITSLEIQPGQSNVLTLYYKPIETDVTVNYYYTTTTIDKDNNRTVEKDKFGDNSGKVTGTFYVGDEFKAADGSKYDGLTYTLDTKRSDNDTISALKKAAEQNVINLYYEGVKDERDEAVYTLYKRFDNGRYAVNKETGKYEIVYDAGTAVAVTKDAKTRAYESASFDINANGATGYTYYEVVGNTNAVTVENGIVTMPMTKGHNEFTVVYRNEPNDDRVAADIKVVHHYTLNKTEVKDGTVTTSAIKNEATEIVKGYYVGEKFTPAEKPVCTKDGKTYTPAGTNANLLVPTEIAAGENAVHLYYSRSEVPAAATITVEHHYIDNVKAYNDEKEEIEEFERENTALAETVEYPKSGEVLYEGQLFIADKIGKEGYKAEVETDENGNAKLDENGNEITKVYSTVLTEGENPTIVINYYKDSDERDTADFEVKHVYIEHKKAVVAGKVQNWDVTAADPTVDNYSGKKGDSYTIAAKEKDGFKLTTDKSVLTGTYKKGTASTITLTYEKSTSDLKAGVLEIWFKLVNKEGYINDRNQYAYRYVAKVENDSRHYADEMVALHTVQPEGIKVFKLTDAATEDAAAKYAGTSEDIPAEIYAGEQFKLDLPQTYTYSGTKYDYYSGSAEITAAPAEAVQADGLRVLSAVPAGEITRDVEPGLDGIVYMNVAELPKGSVKVVKHYTTTTYNTVHEASVENTTAEPYFAGAGEGQVYQGQYVTVTTAEPGFALDASKTKVTTNAAFAVNEDGSLKVTLSTVTADNTTAQVDLYYTKTIDNSQPATVEVTHHYIERDWDKKEKEVATTTGGAVEKLYATQTFTATPVPNGFTSAAIKAEPSMTITLKPGKNTIDLTYYKDVDNRVEAKVTVIHNYYMQDTSGLIPEKTLAGTVNQPISKEEGAWIGNSFTATPQCQFGDEGNVRTYTVDSPQSDYSNIEIVASADGQVVTINYIYKYDARVGRTMKVHHIYKSIDTRKNITKVDDEQLVTCEYGNTNGGVWSVEGTLFTAAELAKAGYVRVTPDEKMTVDYSTEGFDFIVEVEYEHRYSSKKPGGRTDDDPPAPGGTDIHDDDVPLADLPDDEVPLSDLPGGTEEEEMIPDEEVPLADLPVTGGIGVGLFILAGGAIAAAGFGLRRREEEK